MLTVFTTPFCFAHAEYDLMKLKLYNNWSVQAFNNILESAMWNSSKPIKFTHLWKLANQSTLNKVHKIEIAKACTIAFMTTRNSLVIRGTCQFEKNMMKIYFLKLLLIDFA